MNYLVISPYYPQNFQQFTIELANKGITVLGIGQEPYEQLDEPLLLHVREMIFSTA